MYVGRRRSCRCWPRAKSCSEKKQRQKQSFVSNVTCAKTSASPSHRLTSLLHSTSFCAFFRYQHFWFNQTVRKEGRGSIVIFPRSMHVCGSSKFQPWCLMQQFQDSFFFARQFCHLPDCLVLALSWICSIAILPTCNLTI